MSSKHLAGDGGNKWKFAEAEDRQLRVHAGTGQPKRYLNK
jgi:hypothetical protein